MSQYPATFDLLSFAASDGYIFRSGNADDRLGYAVSFAGDLNGDFILDYLIGAPDWHVRKGTSTGTGPGVSYLIYGGTTSLATLDAADGTTDGIIDPDLVNGSTGYLLNGTTNGEASGSAVAFVGNIDESGDPEFAIGAPGDGAGKVTIVSASNLSLLDAADGTVDGSVQLGNVNGSTGYIFHGVASGDRAGISISHAPDQNGDGTIDLLIGADQADPGGTNRGEAYLLFGGAAELAALDSADGTVDANINLSEIDGTNGYRFRGAVNADHAGIAVGIVHDVNGDGIDDLLFGAYLADPGGRSGAGEAYIVFGGATNLAALDTVGGGAADGSILLSAVNGTTGYVIEGTAAGDRAAFSLGDGGDINGDGVADIVMGAYFADPLGQANAGETYIIFGGAANLANLDAADGSANGRIAPAELDGTFGYRIIGIDQPDWSGFSVAAAGDVDGDGFADILIGATYANPHGAKSGEAYVVFGGSQLASLDAADGTTDGQLDLTFLDGTNGFKILGDSAQAQAGFSVSSAGDANGDFLSDILIGAAGSPTLVGGVTESYLLLSRLPDAAVTRTGSVASQGIVGGNFGDVLSGLAGNDFLFGNGGDDYLIGGADDDFLSGGTGSDAADFSGATGAFTIDLTSFAPQAVSGLGSDSLFSIENVTGGNFGDLLLGNADSNSLLGGSGDDTLVGNAGNDTLDGSGDNDVADYSAAANPIVIDATTGSLTVTGVGLGTDSLASIETIIATDFNDTLVLAAAGLSGLTAVLGGAGTDTIEIRESVDLTGKDFDSFEAVTFNTTGSSTVTVTGDQVTGSALTITGDANSNNIVINITAAGVMSIASWTLTGLDSSDSITINGSSGADTILSTIVGDIVFGNGGNDSIFGGNGNDSLDGGADDDLFEGGAGNDTINGGSGSDTVNYSVSGGNLTVNLSLAGLQAIGGGQNSDELISIENVIGGFFNDAITGNADANALNGGLGDDTLIGGQGNDTLTGGGNSDTVSYADATGAVTVDLGNAGAQNVGGTRGTDTLLGIDNLIGSNFGDTLTGNANANRIDAAGGLDVVFGLGGNDTLIGGTSGDTLDGGADNDLIAGGAGNDSLIGGSGTDTLDYSGFGGAVVVNMSNTAAQNTNAAGTDTQSGFENIVGGNFNDDFTGTTGANVMEGGSGSDQLNGLGGADSLVGGSGNDNLQGGNGNDTIVGGLGRDIMVGGGNNDTFLFSAAGESAVGGQRDRINDFVQGTDKVDIDPIDAMTGGGDDDFVFISSAAFSGSGTQGELRFFQLAGPGQTIVEGDIDGNGTADFQIAFIGLFNFNATDFLGVV